MTDSQDRNPELEALETELRSLLDRKYRQFWRPVSSGEEGMNDAEAKALQEEIRKVFDKIRLIDGKYRVSA
ncbi:MAG: hypothetical protein QF492_05085 [Candidatus Krumholzibacteria bacterium]|jgi:hypothetical protein|nr:hypothetical protein [Candidatus Krumholzibacteria bacterium]MDP6669267.1 hypothetical protein [Candidatus Krumholzibacteria bacterium]MDP6796349.1 hypothetical protein [Candidatus Krumholzibacteria bacterium]MDP7021151.1 hypothetical protein [Candidatus Krumholzibacteria bacterium]